MSDLQSEDGCRQLAVRLTDSESPREALQALGEWMACRLGSRDVRWVRGQQCLVRRVSGRHEELKLEGNRWNKRGGPIGVSIASLGVHDDVLRNWRTANRELTVDRPDSVLGIACWVSYFDISRHPKAILTDPLGRVAASELLLADIEGVAIPWFEATRDLENLPSAVPDALLRPTAFAQDLVELLVSRGMFEQAASLVERYISLSQTHEAAFRQGREMAEMGERPQWHSPPALGWSSYILRLG